MIHASGNASLKAVSQCSVVKFLTGSCTVQIFNDRDYHGDFIGTATAQAASVLDIASNC